MTGPALDTTAGVLAVAAGRIEEALPALGRVVADVQQDWLDAAGRAWVDRAVALRRTLDRELDAALAAGRLVASLVERLAEEAVRGPDGDPAPQAADGGRPRAIGDTGPWSAGDPRPRVAEDTAARTGGVAPGTGWSGTGTRRGAGPRLGGTDAQRVDEERGMRIAELDGP